MSWVKLDDGFAEHPKIARLSDKAFRVHVAALCYCGRNLTDGHVPEAIVKSLTLGKKAAVAELVLVGVWHANGDGFFVNDYLDYNPSKVQVETERERRRESGRKGAEKRWHQP